MKPATVFLGEMTMPEVEAFLEHDRTVIVPIGSTEQHGPHGPLATDVVIPQEVARRIAPRVGAVVAPPVNYGLSYPHAGFAGVVHVRISTFMTLIEDLCVSLAALGFERIVLLNGHWDNAYALFYACANAAERLRTGARAFPITYWDAMTPAEAAVFFDFPTGLHANKGETSAVLAVNPNLVDMDLANEEWPPFPDVTSGAAVRSAFFLTSPGTVHRASRSGTWGDARESSVEFGERYLTVVTEGLVKMLDDIDRTFAAMPPR